MPYKDEEAHRAQARRYYYQNHDRYMAPQAKARRKQTARNLLVAKAGREPGSACEICNRVFTRTPHFDHNHATGEFRGWLCGPCNKALGLFQDLPDNLLAAAEYLRKRGFAAG